MFSVETLTAYEHGVPLEKALPIVSHTEGLTAVSLESAANTFAWDDRNNTVKLRIPNNELTVDPSGYFKAMRMAGFSEAISKKVPAKLMIEPLNWVFPNKVGTVNAFTKDNKLVAFAKPNVDIVSVKAMLEIVAKEGGDGTLFERLSHNLNYTNCSVILPGKFKVYDDDRLGTLSIKEKGALVKNKDILYGGLNFSTSIMGEHPTEVAASIYRLVCGNGMVSATEMFKFSRNTESVDFLEWFSDRVKAAIELLDAEFEKVDHLREQLIPEHHRGEVLQNIFAEFNLSEKIKNAVLVRLSNEPPRTMYDVVQAITNVANDRDVSENPLQIRHLQKIGGQIAARISFCETCFSVKH